MGIFRRARPADSPVVSVESVFSGRGPLPWSTVSLGSVAMVVGIVVMAVLGSVVAWVVGIAVGVVVVSVVVVLVQPQPTKSVAVRTRARTNAVYFFIFGYLHMNFASRLLLPKKEELDW